MKEDSLLEGIGSGGVDRVIIAKVKMGVDLLGAIREIVKRARIKKGIIVGGVGALKKAIFRNLKRFPKTFPVKDEDRIYLEIDQPLEIVSLTGHIAPGEGGEPHVHIHFSASTVMEDNVVTLGGHLTEGTIAYVKVAVIIAVIQQIPMRVKFSTQIKSEELAID